VYLIHGSNANRWTRRRAGFVISYDRSGRNDFTVGHGKDYALVPRVSDEDGAEPT
jgi:hypothetical protein